MQVKVEKINNGFISEDQTGKSFSKDLDSLLDAAYTEMNSKLETHAVNITILIEAIEDDVATVDQKTTDVINYKNKIIGLFLDYKKWKVTTDSSGYPMLVDDLDREVTRFSGFSSVNEWLLERIEFEGFIPANKLNDFFASANELIYSNNLVLTPREDGSNQLTVRGSEIVIFKGTQIEILNYVLNNYKEES